MEEVLEKERIWVEAYGDRAEEAFRLISLKSYECEEDCLEKSILVEMFGEEMFTSMDTNEDGSVDYQEWITFLQASHEEEDLTIWGANGKGDDWLNALLDSVNECMKDEAATLIQSVVKGWRDRLSQRRAKVREMVQKGIQGLVPPKNKSWKSLKKSFSLKGKNKLLPKPTTVTPEVVPEVVLEVQPPSPEHYGHLEKMASEVMNSVQLSVEEDKTSAKVTKTKKKLSWGKMLKDKKKASKMAVRVESDGQEEKKNDKDEDETTIANDEGNELEIKEDGVMKDVETLSEGDSIVMQLLELTKKLNENTLPRVEASLVAPPLPPVPWGAMYERGSLMSPSHYGMSLNPSHYGMSQNPSHYSHHYESQHQSSISPPYSQDHEGEYMYERQRQPSQDHFARPTQTKENNNIPSGLFEEMTMMRNSISKLSSEVSFTRKIP